VAIPLSVRLVSPETTVFEGEANSVIAPAWDGQVGILSGHAPMITLLGAGSLKLALAGGRDEVFFLAQGILKVENNEVTILSEFVGRALPTDFEPSEAWPDPADPLVGGLAEPGNPLV
jgi:F-type H+-transporting ATPase subunit epsilon